MKLSAFSIAIAVVVATTAIGLGSVAARKGSGEAPRDRQPGQLLRGRREEGAACTAGRTRTGSAGGDVTVNQMYVQYQVPPNGDSSLPVVMVHGCCLSSKTWETTPDGRMGWDEYFVRRDRPVYLADQVSRARSGFRFVGDQRRESRHRSRRARCRTSSTPASRSRGPCFASARRSAKAFPDGQFPIEAVDELYKQMIPDFNALLPNPNPTWKNMAALAVQLKGAILMGHSESGFFPQQAALHRSVRHPRDDLDRDAVCRI